MSANGSGTGSKATGGGSFAADGDKKRNTRRTRSGVSEAIGRPLGADYSDSFGGVSVASAPCSVCGAAIAVNGGDCLQCLLRTALAKDDESSGEESLEAMLEGIDLQDADWQLGNYHILEEIGRGGMGVIYRARQRHSKRIVALKRVLSYHGDSRETLERFRREAEAAASLDHPNILPIYEVGEADGLPFFTMKLATGGSLQQAAAALSSKPRECVRLLAKVARAVACAHRQGILHRDLKPGNILLDSAGEPLVSDVGRAKWIDTNTDLTRSLAIFGTPGFIAPEQAAGEAAALTPGADIYSLGAILFDLLTGRPPFLGEHAISVIHQAAQNPAPRLRSLNASLDRDLETICAKCLEREPQARYRSAADLAEDLERWIEGRPIVARPVAPPARVWRWAQRNRLLTAALTLGIATAGVTVWWALENRRLQETILRQTAERHSLIIEPVLDLDTATHDTRQTNAIASAFRKGFTALGPADVLTRDANHAGISAPTPSARWSLATTVRSVNGRTRFSHRLTDSLRNEVVARFVVDGEFGGDVVSGDVSRVISRAYQTLTSGNSHSQAPTDPGMANPAALELMTAARQSLERYTPIDFDDAEACIRKALDIEPASATAHARLALVHAARVAYNSNQASLEPALRAAARALELDPDNAEARRAAAVSETLAGRLQVALEHCDRELELNGPENRTGNMKVEAYRRLGRPDAALEWWRLTRRFEVKPGLTDHVAGDCWSALAEDSRAELAYKRFSDLHPDKPFGWMGIAELRLLNNDVKQARQIVDQHLPRHNDHVSAQHLDALLALCESDFARAEELYEQFLRRDPSGGGRFYGLMNYHSALALVRRARGDDQGAAVMLDAARRSDGALLASAPEHPEALYRLAATEAIAGNHRIAIDLLQKAQRAGWIDYRFVMLDPRFQALREDQEFQRICAELRDHVASLRMAALSRSDAAGVQH